VERRRRRCARHPGHPAALEDRYWLGAGDQVIDLRDISDLRSLDGRTLEIEGGVGTIDVILPDGLASTVAADIDGPGHIDLFGVEHGGIGVSANELEGSPDEPEITIDAHLGVGDIEVSYR